MAGDGWLYSDMSQHSVVAFIYFLEFIYVLAWSHSSMHCYTERTRQPNRRSGG